MSNKIKTKKILKDDGERYVFKNGVAIVPGVRFQNKPMKITLKEFNELRSKS